MDFSNGRVGGTIDIYTHTHKQASHPSFSVEDYVLFSGTAFKKEEIDLSH